MQPIIDEHAVAEPDLDVRPSNRPAWFGALAGAMILMLAGYWAMNKYAGHKVIHCSCLDGERQEIVELSRNTDAACQLLCAKVER